jgi:hypothetical protein
MFRAFFTAYKIPPGQIKCVCLIIPVGFEVFTAVVMKSIVFWDMTPCSPLSFNRRFGGTYHLYLQGRRNKFSKNQQASRWQATRPLYSTNHKDPKTEEYFGKDEMNMSSQKRLGCLYHGVKEKPEKKSKAIPVTGHEVP